jgi:hypothetical protein
MKKEDLIKYIAESLEKGLVENLEYDFPFINVLTGIKEVSKIGGTLKPIRKDFKIEIGFVGMFK